MASRFLGVVVRLFVVWQLSLVLAALLCSSLPTPRKTTIATPTTKSLSLRTAGDDSVSSKTDDSDDEDRLAKLWLDDFDVELGQVRNSLCLGRLGRQDNTVETGQGMARQAE